MSMSYIATCILPNSTVPLDPDARKKKYFPNILFCRDKGVHVAEVILF